MSLYAIGDIHGCHLQLASMLAHLNFQSGDTVVGLGDYVDRGPNSQAVIQKLKQLRQRCHLVALRGNHEALMMDARHDWQTLSNWSQCGGAQTLQSYGSSDLESIPASHWDFIYETPLYYETEHHVFVHAGVDPNLAMRDQVESTLLWQRFPAQRPHMSGKKVVCGHTPQTSGWPVDVGHAICLDTHAYATGWLTCMRLDDQHYWQFHLSGEIREGTLMPSTGNRSTS